MIVKFSAFEKSRKTHTLLCRKFRPYFHIWKSCTILITQNYLQPNEIIFFKFESESSKIPMLLKIKLELNIILGVLMLFIYVIKKKQPNRLPKSSIFLF